MANSKTLAELTGGHIGFESEEGVGSTFWVDFPLDQSRSDLKVKIVSSPPVEGDVEFRNTSAIG